MATPANKMLKRIYSVYPIGNLTLNKHYYRDDRYYQLGKYLYSNSYDEDAINRIIPVLGILELFSRKDFYYLCDLVENGGIYMVIDMLKNILKESRRE